jgi:hypothetical protein
MILVDGKPCYSPFPPDMYGKFGGHAHYCTGDLQLWNLMWLSIPKVDDYLVPGANALEVWNSIPTKHTGSIVACLKMPYHSKEYPMLRAWLMCRPELFVKTLFNSPFWDKLPPAQIIPDWMWHMERRAMSDETRIHVIHHRDALYRRLKVRIKV